MADPPAFRTGYLSLSLPGETGEGQLRRLIRESVVRALAATDEWPIRVDVVTGQMSDDAQTKLDRGSLTRSVRRQAGRAWRATSSGRRRRHLRPDDHIHSRGLTALAEAARELDQASGKVRQ